MKTKRDTLCGVSPTSSDFALFIQTKQNPAWKCVGKSYGCWDAISDQANDLFFKHPDVLAINVTRGTMDPLVNESIYFRRKL